jgi:prolyl 4-hydroxylase
LVDAGRRPEGILLLNQLAAQDEPGALLTLAEWKWIGTIVPQDLRQARELYRRADEAGHPGAAAAFTNLLGSGIAGPRDWPLAIRRLRAEARQDRTRRAALSLVEKMKLDANGDPIVAPEGRSLSQSPQVTLFPKLLTPTECEYLRRVADPGFQPSVVIDVKTGRDYADPIRTSDGSTMHWLIEDPAVHALNRRLAAAAGVGAEQGEPLQILRYRPEAAISLHMDFVPGVDNQRVLTCARLPQRRLWRRRDEFRQDRPRGQRRDRRRDRLSQRRGRPARRPEVGTCRTAGDQRNQVPRQPVDAREPIRALSIPRTLAGYGNQRRLPQALQAKTSETPVP